MKVQSQGPAAQDRVPEPATQNAAPPSSPYKDALYTVGKVGQTVGWGLFTCFSFVARKAWYLVLSYLPKKQVEVKPISIADLLNIGKLEEHFESDPFSVIMKIVNLINNDPKNAETILANFAQHCKDNPKDYSPYGGGVKQQLDKRKSWILKVNDVVTKCLLTPRQREIEKKVEEGDLTSNEGYVIGYDDKTWVVQKNRFNESEIQFRQDYKEAQLRKEKFSALWQTLLLQLDADFSDLSLGSHSPTNNPFQEESVTFGGFIERLLFNTDGSKHNLRKLTNLQTKGTFDHWANYSKVLLNFILTEKDISPNILELCRKVKLILENDEKRATLHGIVSRVVAIFRPKG